ncbi:PAS domain-containing protein [Leptospira sarikeiensis]|uniref:PAS domain-containing protein n=1 Tax=Leptospira sarikeiensis TaxID=2484943 RepID=A0A4V3JS69_9LEPT|nr:PAS domain-containing protein [Leptospira sarikeiensis]TGL63520.1 PAS domain-containing protein [Leptospira sarikeiensis]
MDLSLENVKELVQRQESMPDILLICDSNGRILHINENGRKTLGIQSVESAKTMSLADFLSETDRKYFETVILPNVAKVGEFGGRALRLIGKDGNYLQTKQLVYSMPELSYLVVFSEDKNSESEKKDALYKAFQQSQNGMFLTDKEGVILAVNKQFEKISGLKEEELVGKTPKAFQSGSNSSKTFYDEFWESVLQGSVSVANSNIKNGFVNVSDWKQNVTPIRDRNGEVSSFLSTILANPEGDDVKAKVSDLSSPSDTFRKYEGMDRETLIGILRDKTKLTKKETEICAGIASGKDKSRISEDLGIHPGTMKNHLKSIYRKTIDLEKEIPGPERDKLQRLTIYLFRLLG